MNFKKKIKSYLPYRKMDELIKVTFHFSAMTNEEAGKLHDNFNTYGSWTCPHVDITEKIVTAQFCKDDFIPDSIIDLLKKEGFLVISNRVDIEPSDEHQLNCVTVIILGVIVYILLKVLL